MKIRQIFKMVKAANELNELIKEKNKIVEIRFKKYSGYKEYESFSAFRNVVEKEFDKEEANAILNAELEMEQDETHYFSGERTKIGYTEIMTVHIF